MTKASLIFYPLKQKEVDYLPIPMYLRIVIHRRKAEARLNLEIPFEKLANWDPAFMRFTDWMEGNRLLTKYQQQFDNLVYANATHLESITAHDLRDMVLGVKSKGQLTVIEYVRGFLRNAILSNQVLVQGTKRHYENAVRHLERFLEHVKQKHILIVNADGALANRFYDYLLSFIPLEGKVSIVESTAAGYIKKLKRIFQRAHDEGLIDRNPFAKLKLKTQSKFKEKLSTEEVKILFFIDLTDFPSLEKVRDIFLFSVFTGLAYNDAMRLSEMDIAKWKSNEYYLRLVRQKTDVQTKLFLVSFAISIMTKYGSMLNPRKQAKVLPVISNQQLNMRLKILGDKAEISTPLTSHTARHTFRQLISEAGITDLAAIKTMMGHSRKRDIDAIYHSVTEQQLFQAKKKFQSFLSGFLKVKNDQ